MNQPRVLDLFCGCGGLSKGFEDAGFEIVLGIDNDVAALKTFENNHLNSKTLCADLSNEQTFKMIKDAIDGDIDVIVAGPPCQGFSLTGPRNFDDDRNKLYLAVIKTVQLFKPKVFVIENVPGMETLYNGQIKSEIVNRFKKMGYDVKTKILCAADYGVPQMRKRLFFVGVLDNDSFEFPVETFNMDAYITCEDAISDLPSREDSLGKELDEYTVEPITEYQKEMRLGCHILYNHVATNHTQLVKDVIKLVPDGGNHRDLPPGVGDSRKFNEAWTRYHSKKPSKTIDTGHRNHFHYKYNRVPTIRENARLQSFRDDFVFFGSKTQQNRQVGNAVPPLLGRVIAQMLLQIIEKTRNNLMKKINSIDLFAGCGGLMEGFEQEGSFNTLGCVEWEKSPCENLSNRLRIKWGYENADELVMRFDVQRSDELFNGYNDTEYGHHVGLDSLVGNNNVDIIIGGPPCQAYSLAGRIRDDNGMRDDYRNYLFESYIKVVSRYQPSFFIFENVPGMLSSKPNGIPITDIIAESFNEAGYYLHENLRETQFDMTDYGIPQNRKRLIILGVNKNKFPRTYKEYIDRFYRKILPKYMTPKQTVEHAISDLPKLFPLKTEEKKNGEKFSHSFSDLDWENNHIPRFHNKRDMKVFNMLAEDIINGNNRYCSSESLKELYTEITGRKSNVHKYHVLRWDDASNTIPAHLYKDGLRHIHPDPDQARSITVREAARLQTFPDDYKFIGGIMQQYKMIGNAVPPKFSEILAKSVRELFSYERTS